MSAATQIVWFKRDLRIEDNAALFEAAARGPVIPLYIAEPELWRQPDASGRHWAFIAETLAELQRSFEGLAQPLIIRTGDSVAVLDAIRKSHGAAALWSHEETGNGWTFARDKAVAAWAREHGVQWRELCQTGVIRRLKNRTGWAKAWDGFMATSQAHSPRILPPIKNLHPGGIPSVSDLGIAPDACPERQSGGRRKAMATLDSFLAERGRNYRRGMSSPVTGFEQCSRLSPHLAFGSISMRETAQAVWRRLGDLKGDPTPEAKALRASLVSYFGRLHWHCHFMQKLESEPRIEFENFHRAYDGVRPSEADPGHLAAWSKGETGFPFLDACMRALNATGWMNFRMRAMLMSFASYQLWLPWRETGLHLARQFTDYEPGIHWPQTQMQSGTTGINTVRVYNPVKQGYDQDPHGVFVRRWLPELAGVPDAFIHEPWKWEGAAALLGGGYPERIVHHIAAAKAAQLKIYGARRSGAFHVEADGIQEKHGSRKSGILAINHRRTGERCAPSQQMSLDLPTITKD